MVHRVLVVEDDPDIRDLLVMSLESVGHEVATAATGAAAVEQARAFDPDLVTLDLSLPDMDGVDLCRQLRSFTDAYIVMITGRTDEIDRLVGLEVGADDYLSKPFSPQELRARAAALLRRPRVSAAGAAPAGPVAADLILGRLVISPHRQEAVLDGESLPLTDTELGVLAALAENPGQVWAREDLTRRVWQGDFIESDYLVDVHIASLRRKLRRRGDRHQWIATVGGAAYRFDPAP